MNRFTKAAIQVAMAYREELRETGEFTQGLFRDALPSKLQDYHGSAYDALCDFVAEYVDKQATREAPQEDQPFLPGLDMGGEYKLGDGRRVAKRKATIEHAEEMLELDRQNLERVTEASARKLAEVAMLRPYWLPGLTKEQAVRAYLAANPQAS